jgi:DNA polymerase III subunit chi
VRDGDADLQPIWLTALDEAPNGARFLFLIDGAESARLDAFARVFDLFDGNDAAALEAARVRWRAAKDAGHALTYWQQGERGWEKKA